VIAQLVDWIAGEPKDVVREVAGLTPGKRAVAGRIRAGEPVFSPVRRSRCAGFYYRATFRVGSRMRGFIQRKLRDSLVYGGDLVLELPDGTVALQPKRCDSLEHEEHVALQQTGYDGFNAKESVIPDGAQVRVYGRVRRGKGGEGWRMVFYLVELEEPDKKEKAKRKRRAKVVRRGRKASKRKR